MELSDKDGWVYNPDEELAELRHKQARIEAYRAGYTCGYTDAKDTRPFRDKDAACLFFGEPID